MPISSGTKWTTNTTGPAVVYEVRWAYPNELPKHMHLLQEVNGLVDRFTKLILPVNLGSGSDISTKFLRGDNTWQEVSGTGSGGNSYFPGGW